MHSSSEQDSFRVCVIQVSGERFALRLESVREIVPMAALSRPPSMPSVLEGFLNLGGVAIPVVKVAELLGLPEDSLDLHTPLVILRGATLPLAFLVNRVLGIVSVPSSDFVRISETNSFNGCVDGRLTILSEAVHLLSVDRLLLEKERLALIEFQTVESRRLRQIEPRPL